MPDEIDELLGGDVLKPPPDFARRVTALARAVEQDRAQTRSVKPWQWLSLGAGAGLGALMLCEFVFFAFVAASAQ